jgi:hypothetical protein
MALPGILSHIRLQGGESEVIKVLRHEDLLFVGALIVEASFEETSLLL